MYTIMTNEQNKHIKRAKALNALLIRGDKTKISKALGISREWVSYVLNGRGVSTPVLQAAEELINSRKNRNY